MTEELPPGWSEVELSELGLPPTPKIEPRLHASETFELYSVPSFDTGEPEHVQGSSIASVRQVVQPGDVLLCKINPRINRVWVVGRAAQHRQIASTEWVVVRPTGMESGFFQWQMRDAEFRERLLENVSGVGGSLMRARPEGVRRLTVKVPPLAEQRRIVAQIEGLFARTRRARAELGRVVVLAKKYRERVLVSAFSGDLTAEWRSKTDVTEDGAGLLHGLNETTSATRGKPPSTVEYVPSVDLPSSWVIASVDHLTSAVDYGTSKQAHQGVDGVPVLRMGNLVDGRIDVQRLKYLPDDHDEFPKLFLTKGDVLFNRTNSAELVGKAAVYDGEPSPCSFASYLIRLRTKGVKPELLSAYINSPFGRDWVAGVVSQQVGQANVNGTKLRSLGVPLAPEAEQAVIVKSLASAFAKAENAQKEAARSLALLDRLDAAILARAFRGELVPQDPADEPARLPPPSAAIARPRRRAAPPA